MRSPLLMVLEETLMVTSTADRPTDRMNMPLEDIRAEFCKILNISNESIFQVTIPETSFKEILYRNWQVQGEIPKGEIFQQIYSKSQKIFSQNIYTKNCIFLQNLFC